MAGAKHTNRHLQRLMLRGLVLPAAAAGAIVLGASAASADEGSGAASLESAASDVQSAVEAAGTTVTPTAEGTASGRATSSPSDSPPTAEPTNDPAASTIGAEPPTPSPASQPSSGPGSGGSQTQLAETAASPVEDGPAAPMEHSAAGAVDSREAVAVPEKASVTEGHEALPSAPLPAEALPTGETAPEGLPATQLVSGATATVDEVTRPVAGPLDRAAPLPDQAALRSDRLSAPIDEATPIYDRVLDELATAPAPAVDGTKVLEAELLAPVRELDQVVEPTIAPVRDTLGGLAEQSLAPAVATTPIFTGVATGLLTDLGDVATGTSGPVLASVTETTPLYDEVTREILTPTLGATKVTAFVDQVTALLLSPDPLLGQVVPPLVVSSLGDHLAPLAGVPLGDLTPLPSVLADAVTPRTNILLPPLDPASGEAATTAPTYPAWQPSPSSATPTGHPAATAEWAAAWTPAYDVSGSTTSASASDTGQPSTAVPPLAGSLDLSAWPAPVASEPIGVETPGDGDVDPLPGSDRSLLTQIGGLVEAVTASGGGQQGVSGSVLLLLLAVFGAALLARAGGLAQLTPGTATALSGRAAQVQDRPG